MNEDLGDLSQKKLILSTPNNKLHRAYVQISSSNHSCTNTDTEWVFGEKIKQNKNNNKKTLTR